MEQAPARGLPEVPADPVQAAKALARFIRCQAGRTGNRCNGTGVVRALASLGRDMRLCSCIENALREAGEYELAEATRP